MQHQTSRHEAVDDEVAIHLQVQFHVPVIGVHVEFGFDGYLTNRLPCVLDTHGRTDVMLRLLPRFQAVVGDGDPRRVAHMNHLVRERRDGDGEVLHRFVVETERT